MIATRGLKPPPAQSVVGFNAAEAKTAVKRRCRVVSDARKMELDHDEVRLGQIRGYLLS
jgi:hypothetical protein